MPTTAPKMWGWQLQSRFLLLARVLVSIAGCSEKIEAQENASEAREIGYRPSKQARQKRLKTKKLISNSAHRSASIDGCVPSAKADGPPFQFSRSGDP